MHARPLCFLVPLALVFSATVAAAATVSGHVSDPDGRVVQGVRVLVFSPLGTAGDVTTDPSGAFEVRDLYAGTYEVRVVAKGFQADPISLALAENDTRDLSIPLRLAAVSESVVVSASQVAVPLSQAADTVTVVTSADLETRQAETVSDALRLVPGLAVVRSGGRGALTSLFPRGGNSNYTLVLVDGIRANSFGGGYDFAHLPVADIDHVEIVREPQSALFGSDAIGSVVQIVTRRGGRPRVAASFEGGGQDAYRQAVDASGSTGGWTWGGGAEHLQSTGYTGPSSGGEPVVNDDYHLSHVSGSVGHQSSGGTDLLVAGNLSRNERGFPGPYGSNPIDAYGGVDDISRGVNNTRQIGGRFSHPWSPRIRQRADASYTDVSGDFTSPYGPSSSGSRRFDARVQEDFSLSTPLAASAGVEWLRERGSSTYITGASGDAIPILRNVAGVFGELRYVKAERLFLTAGVRAEHIARDALEANADAFSPRPVFPEQSVNSANPKVALSYVVHPSSSASGASTRVHASAGTGIRPPDAFEIAFTDNPNLLPERSRSLDAGVEQHFRGGAFVMGATAFFNRYDDLIVAVGTSIQDASHYKTDNISNARARGVEISGDAALPHGLSLHANYTLLDSEVLSIDRLDVAPPPFTVGDPLIRRPRHQGVIDLVYGAGRVGVFADVLMRGKTLDVEPSYGAFGGLFDTPGYGVVNAGATVRVSRQVDIYARVINLADHQYEETLGYPALRRQE